MSSIRDLVQLQDVDTALATRRTQLADIVRRLEDRGLIEELVAQQATVQQTLTGIEREQRAAEAEVQDARAHLGDVEGKLYSGAVRNPKELVSLQQDADMVRGQLGKLEDTSLGVMTRLEEQQRTLKELQEQITAAEAEHASLTTALSADKARFEAEIAQLEARRNGIVERVPADDMQLYTSMYGARQGRAVAKVERTLCQGCRVNLPSVVVQRVRASQKLVQCPSCQRILYSE